MLAKSLGLGKRFSALIGVRFMVILVMVASGKLWLKFWNSISRQFGHLVDIFFDFQRRLMHHWHRLFNGLG